MSPVGLWKACVSFTWNCPAALTAFEISFYKENSREHVWEWGSQPLVCRLGARMNVSPWRPTGVACKVHLVSEGASLHFLPGGTCGTCAVKANQAVGFAGGMVA